MFWEHTFRGPGPLEASIQCFRTADGFGDFLLSINGKSIVLTTLELKAFHSMLIKAQAT